MYGVIVAEPRQPDPIEAERDYTVLLSDWTDESPVSLLQLKKMGGYNNFGQPTVPYFIADVSNLRVSKAIAKRRTWNGSCMSPTDLGELCGATYTYLMNCASPARNWTALAKVGERVR